MELKGQTNVKKIYKVLVLGGLVTIGWGAGTKLAHAATLSLSPTSQTVTIGNTFNVTINLDTTSQAVYGVDVFSLHFNPSVLQVVDADGATAGVQITAGTLMSSTQYNSVDNTAGVIQFSQTPSAGGVNFTGSGVLATITFQAVTAGTSAVTFDFALNSTTDTNVAGLYSDLLTSVTNASYTVSNASDTTAPSVPTGLAAAASSATQINLTWNASTDPTIAGQTTSGVAGYKIFRCSGASCAPTVQVATSTTNSLSNTGLTAATSYTYAVASYDNSGNTSAKSTNSSATTQNASDATAPSVPTGLTATSPNSAAANLSWTASTDPTVAGQSTTGVSGYKIFRCSGASCTATVQVATSTTTTFADSGLTPSTSYSYRLQAYDGAGNSSGFSTAATVTTQTNADVTAPTVPLNVSAQVISATQVNLSWSASTDPTVAGQVTSGVAGYKIFRGGVQVATTTTASYSNTGLTPATNYSYNIASYDTAGNASAQTSAVAVTTSSLPDTTSPTVSLTSPASGSQNGTITFAASASDPTIAGAVTSGVSQITLLIDNIVFATSSLGSVSLSVSLDTTKLINGTHSLTATARDNAGNTGNSGAVSIDVFNVVNATRFPRKFVLTNLEGRSSLPAGQSITAQVIAPTTGLLLSTQTLTPDAGGAYTVTFQSSFPQVVSVRISVNGYLSSVITNIDTTVNSATSLSVPQLLGGDFNSDNTINTLDYSLLNSHWNQNFTQTDINADGLVNSLDFAVLKNNWNKTGQ